MKSALKIESLSFSYNGANILEDVNLDLPEKEFVGIIGPNGGGKTTLLKLILGLLEPKSGRILIFDKPIKKQNKFVGYVPQYSSFDSHFPISVWDVVLSSRLGKSGLFIRLKKEDHKIVSESLAKVNILDLKNEMIGNLSGGQKQRVLIARALAAEPKILLLDEPTASIDTKAGKSFYDLLHQLNENMTIILVSHDIGAVSQYVNKIACLNKSLIFHDSKEITKEMLEATYECPVDLIAHGIPHRVLHEHKHD